MDFFEVADETSPFALKAPAINISILKVNLLVI